MTSVYLSLLFLSLTHPTYRVREDASVVVARLGGCPTWMADATDAELAHRARQATPCGHCGGNGRCPLPGQRLADCGACLDAANARGEHGIYRGDVCGPCEGRGRR